MCELICPKCREGVIRPLGRRDLGYYCCSNSDCNKLYLDIDLARIKRDNKRIKEYGG